MKQHFAVMVDINDMMLLNPHLLIMLSFVNLYCHQNNLPCTITSMVRPPDTISQSTTHQEGRAFDLSLYNWTKEDRDQLEKVVNSEFDHVGAISSKTYKSTPIYIHKNAENKGLHAHFQVRKGL